ncbi:MAG: hypothetical protein ACYC1K_01665 [Minisyncoccota bacterium]
MEFSTVSLQQVTGYLLPEQREKKFRGAVMMEILLERGLMDRSLHKDSEIVKRWIELPSTYPQEFRGKKLALWKSANIEDEVPFVPCLVWRFERVVVEDIWLGDIWCDQKLNAVVEAA